MNILVKRWYAALPVLLLTVAASFATMESVQPSYQYAATLVLLVPSGKETQSIETSPDRPINNPYLQFTNSLKAAADIVSVVMTSDSMRQRMTDSGMSSDYEVIPTTPISPTPILTVTATSRDEFEARRTLRAIVKTIRSELDKKQISAGATRNSRIQVQVASAPTIAKRVVGSTVRAVGVTVALGLGATFSVACLIEFMAGRRRVRRGRRLRSRGRSTRSGSRDDLQRSRAEGASAIGDMSVIEGKVADSPAPASAGWPS